MARAHRLNQRIILYLYPKPPYNFELTMRKPAGWALFTQSDVYEEGVLWTALHVGEMLVGLRLRSQGSTGKPEIRCEAFFDHKPNDAEKKALIDLLMDRLAVNEDISDFYRMAKKDPILRHTFRRHYGMHDTNFYDLFPATILAVCLQMAPMERSNSMMDCLIGKYGEISFFQGKKIPVWPLPERIAKLDEKELRVGCKLGYRAKYLVGIARILEKGDFPGFEMLKLLTPEQAKEKLLELPGIGDYSTDIINPHGGFPIDVWSADIFGRLFFGKRAKVGRDAIERIKKEGIRRWGRWSWMAFFYVVNDLPYLSKKLGVPFRLE